MSDRELLHRPALEMVLTLATSPKRWTSRAQLASDVGVAPSTFSMALRDRGLSDTVLEALAREVPGVTREALLLPVRARPGDLETVRLHAELKRLTEQVTRGTNDIAAALRERNGV